MIDFKERLQALKDRRQGSRESVILKSTNFNLSEAINAIASGGDIRKSEGFEKLKEPSGVRYSIGAMSPVDSELTKESINEGYRVADNLINILNKDGENTIRKMQGSVALDIHIKGHSDIDILIITANPVNIETPEVNPSHYSDSYDLRTINDIAKDVRYKSEKILPIIYPKSKIDCTGNKSITVSDGGLCIKVDIVPAVWFDCIKYQKSKQEHDRGIKIYHKKNNTLLLNYPFTHIKKVHDKDINYLGNLRCVIRLMKNMIADMPDSKKIIAKRLTSYDLAAIGYHMDDDLKLPLYLKLGLVEKTRSHLKSLLGNKNYRELLDVPDGTRKIFDDNNKTEALEILTEDFNDLAISIFNELQPLSRNYNPSAILSKAIY